MWGDKPSDILSGTPSYAPQEHLARVRKIHAEWELNNAAAAREWTLKTLTIATEDKREKIPHKLIKQLWDCVERLFVENGTYNFMRPVPSSREILEQIEEELSPEKLEVTSATLIAFVEEIIASAPRSAFMEDKWRGPTVPLYELFPTLQNFIDILIRTFNRATFANDRFAFPGVVRQFMNNVYRLSGIDPEKPSTRKLLTPLTYDGDPLDFLEGTPFIDVFKAQVPFHIPQKTFASHGIILAPPNHGKTQLLGSLITNFLRADDTIGLFVLDPHGDLYSNLRTRVDSNRLICLDADTSPPPLNFLDFGNSTEAQTLQTFSYLMSSLSGGLSDKQGAIVPYLLKLLRKIPSASLETLRLLCDEKVKRPEQSQFAVAINNLDAVDQGFFHNQFYNARMQETKDAIGWKLYSALSSDAFREMFSAKHNSFDADAAMRDRKVVLVKGARKSLGDEGMKVFLQFIVAQFFAASLRRESIDFSKRSLGILFVDEAHHVFNSQTVNILTECRKYGLGFMAATQVVQQIPEDVKAAIYGATAIKIAGPVSHNDASILSREMYTTTDFIRSMKPVEASHADWAMFVSGLTDRAIRVRVPYGTLESLPTHEATEKVASRAALLHEIPSASTESRDTPQLTTSPDDTDEITTGGKGGWKK